MSPCRAVDRARFMGELSEREVIGTRRTREGSGWGRCSGAREHGSLRAHLCLWFLPWFAFDSHGAAQRRRLGGGSETGEPTPRVSLPRPRICPGEPRTVKASTHQTVLSTRGTRASTLTVALLDLLPHRLPLLRRRRQHAHTSADAILGLLRPTRQNRGSPHTCTVSIPTLNSGALLSPLAPPHPRHAAPLSSTNSPS